MKIWLYFAAFTLIVFVLLWIFQVYFLENFYERMKIGDVRNAAEELVDNYGSDDYDKLLTKIAFDNDVCIEILDKYNRSIYTREVMGQCLIHGRNSVIFTFMPKLYNSENGEIYYKNTSPSGDESLLYGCIIGDKDNPDAVLFLNSKLVPVGSTASIIKRQLMIITFILIVIAFLLSIYVAQKIAKPISQITKSAGRLAVGDYTTKFEGKGYAEAQLLANTLNYASEEISKVDTLQRDLIANVSHDLRTPLTMLKAYAEMIRDLSGDNPVKREEHLNIIIEETDRLALLVNDMLDLSKLESGRQKLTRSEFGITGKLNEIIERYKGVSGHMGYHIHFTPDEERIVYCDVVKIEQVIYNLINNAINYTGEDKQVYVSQINLPNGVRIEVRDTGQGIEDDKIKLIFDKYYRSENHKREVVGSGLGLSIVKAILKLHNYDYGVNSTIGKGSVFWFVIKDVKYKETADK